MSNDTDKAYQALLKRWEDEGMDKEAGWIAPTMRGIGRAGRAVYDKVPAALKWSGNEYKQIGNALRRDPTKTRAAVREGDSILDSAGGIMRGSTKSMSGANRHFNNFANMTKKELDEVAARSEGMGKVFYNRFNKLNRDAANYRKFGKNEHFAKSIADAQAQVARGGVESLAPAQRKFMERMFGSHFDDATARANAISRYGMKGADGSWTKADWIGDTIGQGINRPLGAFGVVAPATFAPFTMSEWGGAGSAAGSASEYGMQGGMAGAADRFHSINNQPFSERMRTAWNPDRNLARMYMNDPQNAGQAYNYMFGPGKLQHVETPGLGDMAKELVNPLFGGETYLQKRIRAKSHQQFQKMGSDMSAFDEMTEMEKEAALKAIQAGGTAAWDALKLGFGAIRKTPKNPNLPADMPNLPPVWSKARRAHRKSNKPAPRPINQDALNKPHQLADDANLWGKFKHYAGGPNPQARMLVAGAGIGLPASFYAGRKQVQQGAYTSGYGAGQAYTTKKYGDMPMLGRMGAGVSSDLTLKFLKSKYPEFYKSYANRHLPAGMR